MPRHEESSHQQAFFQWLKLYPDVFKVTWHTPNSGKRTKFEAYRLKREGLLKGVPDIFIGIAINGFHGYFIELKSKKGKVDPSQKKLHLNLIDNGYKVDVCYSWHEARSNLLQYLKGSKYDVRLHAVPE